VFQVTRRPVIAGREKRRFPPPFYQTVRIE
jgi:hypothetical protein